MKHNRELRIKLFEFLTLIFVLNAVKFFNHSGVYDGIKTCSQLHFFTYESMNTSDNVETSCLYSDLQYRNSNSYFNLPLLLSGDISLNPGPLCNDQLQWSAAVIGISKSILDDSALSSEIHIDNYNTLRFERNKHERGVVCYIKND